MATLIKRWTAEDNWSSVSDFAPVSCPIVPGVSPYAWTFQISSSIFRSGSKSYRTELRGEHACNDSYRAEIIFYGGDENSPISQFGIEIWYGFSFYIPSDYPVFTGSYPNKYIYQYQHGLPEVGALLNPAPSPYVIWQLQHRTASSATRTSQTLGTMSVQRGAWHDVVYRHVRRLDNQGLFRLWLNGVAQPQLNYDGYSAFLGADNNLGDGCQTKHGLYGGTDTVFPWVLYFDNISIAVGTNGFDLVNPGDSGSTTTFTVDAGGPYSGVAGVPVQLDSTVTPA